MVVGLTWSSFGLVATKEILVIVKKTWYIFRSVEAVCDIRHSNSKNIHYIYILFCNLLIINILYYKSVK